MTNVTSTILIVTVLGDVGKGSYWGGGTGHTLIHYSISVACLEELASFFPVRNTFRITVLRVCGVLSLELILFLGHERSFRFR